MCLLLHVHWSGRWSLGLLHNWGLKISLEGTGRDHEGSFSRLSSKGGGACGRNEPDLVRCVHIVLR